MATVAEEMEEGGVGVDLEYGGVEIDAAVPEGEEKPEGEGVKSVRMEDDGGEEASACVAASSTIVVVEAAMVRHKGKESRESSGRKKRKERENGVGDVEDAEMKDELKKRRNEKDMRKRRESGEGTEKREHRDKKESKRKKDRKERREERDGKSRKARVAAEEVDDWEQLEKKGRDSRLDKNDGGRHRRANRDHERRVSRSFPDAKDQMAVFSSVVTSDSKYSFASESHAKSVTVDDDDKEEGEILDEESSPVKVAESEVESGEIETINDATITGEDMRDSQRSIERSRWKSPTAEASNSVSEHSMLDRNGKSASTVVQEKPGQAAPSNPLQSMLVIAEAYDSESPVSEEKFGFPPVVSVVKAESRHQHSKKAQNGSRKSELPVSDKKSGVEKGKAHDKVELKSHSMGPPEQRSNVSKDRKVFSAKEEIRSRPEDNKARSSHRSETWSGSNSERGEVKEQPIVDRPKSRVTRYSESPEREDCDQVGGNRGNDKSRRRRSPPRKEFSREKDHSKGRSRSKERCLERGRSSSVDSMKGRECSRRRTRSPEPAEARNSRKVCSPSRESLRDRRAESVERRKRSRSRDRGPEIRHSRDKNESFDRRRRSRSRESGRLRASARAGSTERRRRSRSRDSLKDKIRGGSRRADSYERSQRSRSRSVRERRIEDRITSRHTDGPERKRRSKSKDSPRDRKVGDRDSARHIWRGDDSRHRNSRDDRHYDGSRDNIYRADRDRDRNYNNSHGRNHNNSRDRNHNNSHDRNYKNSYDRNRSDKDLEDKGSQQSARDSVAAEAIREEENQEEYQERVASQLAAQEDDDVERVKEESRKRRQAILEKYKKQQTKLMDEQPRLTETGHTADVVMANVNVASLASPVQKHLSPVLSASSDLNLSLERPLPQNGAPLLTTPAENGVLGGGSPKSERSPDMFCDDIFGESPAGGRRLGKGDGLAMDTSGLIDNWDDAEGYYCFRIGEVLDGRYEVASSHGRGVFSTVVRARDMKPGRGEPEEVAIKIIRNNETMYKAGQQELVILKKLAGADPENKRHCVRLLSSFEYRSHLCLVFESLHMNLREILKKFGRNIGINLNAVRSYAKQLFTSLKHLRNCGVLHCDIKPDNMLVNESKNVLKVCDFGSAMFAGENEITPYLVSRFYRAPEIILGLPYDHALDIWSVGCCLYELYTGKMLFPGHANNDMLRLHMELKGPFPKKMLKKAAFADQHFDQDFNFCAIEEDPVTKKTIKRILVNLKPRDTGIPISGSGTIDEDSKMLASFKDLLEKIFILDPDKRLTVSQALSHSFISGK